MYFATVAYNDGIKLLECTFDATGNTPDEEIAYNIKMLADHFEGKMLIGAGKVLTEPQAAISFKLEG